MRSTEYLEIALLLLKERAAVGYKILQIAKLRSINRRIVDFGDNPIPNREPEMAGCGVCRADAILVAVRPAGLNAWFSKRFCSSNSLHPRTSSVCSLRCGTEQQMVQLCSNLVCGSCQRRWSVCDRVSSVDGIA